MPEKTRQAEGFIRRWEQAGGGERANYQMFLTELCRLIEAPEPEPHRAEDHLNAYVFERRVPARPGDEASAQTYIDLYRRGSFVLEAKQSRKRPALPADAAQAQPTQDQPTQAQPGSGWDTLMRQAREQAEGYARRLPAAEGWPPFLVVVDVGHAIELYADFSCQGKYYAQFPDRQSHRILLPQLRDPALRRRLRQIWVEPLALDPARHTAAVTRDIAALLAKLSLSLERKLSPDPSHAQSAGMVAPEVAERVAMFLMRCLFTMFAGSIGLLRGGAFHAWLKQYRGRAGHLHHSLQRLWLDMDRGGFSPELQADLLRFNGGLFRDAGALPLDETELELLLQATGRDWKDVEPAIFGTLLERALSPAERHRLGAHYTPRLYVERLVVATVIEPLREDWRNAQAVALRHQRAGRLVEARQALRDFHHALCAVRVLDPACGTGNFLYVALEMMKRLEGEVLSLLVDLGEQQERLRLAGETVDPHQFLGLEINPRAVAIAELVLWIGYLQWHFRTFGDAMPGEPVLKSFNNIQHRDAILAHDGAELQRDATGRPLSRWDGQTRRQDALTGDWLPDDSHRRPLERYRQPRPASWPRADFIIGNPPFIGGKDMRQELGDGYAEACWAARHQIPAAADFVMHFWDQAAWEVRNGRVRRFGFITTNSITQNFSRRVIAQHLAPPPATGPATGTRHLPALVLLLAIPDHPWIKGAGRADVRIAMTVAARADRAGPDGRLLMVQQETDLDSDAPRVLLQEQRGPIQADLSIGAAVVAARPLRANAGLCSPGVKLHGAGFIVTPPEAQVLGLGRVPGLERHILPYRNGRDLAGQPRGVLVIDLYPLDEATVCRQFPQVYQWLADRVRPEREARRGRTKDATAYADAWWWFGKPRPELKKALAGLPRYIATIETAKHRIFQFLDAGTRPDNMLVAIATTDAYALGVLSSRFHVAWALAAGGRLGVGNDPRYTKTQCFDPFPFPGYVAPALRQRIADLAERLDAQRKQVLAQHRHLSLTGLYNVLEKLRAGAPLDDAERDIHAAGLVGLLRALHDDLDTAVAEAYGWPRDLAAAAAVARLATLNQARAEEEADGLVRWLRPDFQAPDTGAEPAKPARQLEADLLPAAGLAAKPALPKALPDQVAALRHLLRQAPAPLSSDELAAHFATRRGQRGQVAEILDALTLLGQADRVGERYRLSGD